MAGDQEKRFQKIMDRLYHAPKPKSSNLSGNGTSSLPRGKRPEPGLRGALEKRSRFPATSMMPSLGPAPSCRPWDRGDLLRRLTTFKAMTWFGKPKSVSPINCARRGWINVEMDVIACEACGARLLFSTSSSWTMQQVEKAAAVFSLKLDNGHKLLCPWIDNPCDQALTLFPPTPPTALVEGYKERASMLLRLTGLPVISSSAIDYMKSPQLEHFLSQGFHPSITLSNGIKLTDSSGSKDFEGASENVAVNLYYQALKITSLCGWEPRLLPYAVDCEDQSNLLTKSTYSSESSAQTPGLVKHSIILNSSSIPSGLEVGKNVHPLLGEYQYDPQSIVLDCRFCGACVGLWAFSNTQCPLEFFRVDADFSGQPESAFCSADVVCGVKSSRTQSSGEGNQFTEKGFTHTGYDGPTTKERSLGLNFTIAGGPPPTKQNFRPRVSFPIISRHLRAEFGSIPGAENCVRSNISCRNQVNSWSNVDPSVHQKDINGGLVFKPEGLGKRKRSEDEDKSSDCVLNEETTGGISSEQENYNLQEIDSLHECSGNLGNSEEVMGNRSGDLDRNDTCSKEFEKEVLNTESEADKNVVGESLCTTSNPNETIQTSEARENKSGSGSAVTSNPHDGCLPGSDSYRFETSENNHLDPVAPCSAIHRALSSTHSSESGNGGKVSDFQNLDEAHMNNQKGSGVENKTLSSISKAYTIDYASGNIKGFDPIRQHRPFCPWIATEEGENMPGWKLTLAALIRQEKHDSPHAESEPPSTLLDEEDDPIVSVRRLFMSPPAKRLKGSH